LVDCDDCVLRPELEQATKVTVGIVPSERWKSCATGKLSNTSESLDKFDLLVGITVDEFNIKGRR
jgi:hypothetical protein